MSSYFNRITIKVTRVQRFTHLGEFLNVGSTCTVQFEAFREPFNEQLLLGRGLVPGSHGFSLRPNGGFGRGGLL